MRRSPSRRTARCPTAASRCARSWNSSRTYPVTAIRLPAPAEVAAAVADAHRREWAFVLAATVRVTRDLDLAEECVQDAYASALSAWPTSGVPARAGAWLTTAARNRALDLLRRDQTARRHLPLLLDDPTLPGPESALDTPDIPDDRLRLIFTCCHPGLAVEAQVALTLRLLCGLTTAEVARAFLVSEPTMAARITRAKKKIANARIPYRVPSAADLPARVEAVLSVVHLLYTTGHTAPSGSGLIRADLVQRSLDLARMLRELLPRDTGVAALLALILLTDARSGARTDPGGRLVLLGQQDRSLWDRQAISEGTQLVREALRSRPPSRYALMAAIAAVHSEAPSWAATDWAELVGLYDLLMATWPSPVVALNRAVAVGFAHGPLAGLHALDELSAEPQLARYAYLAVARAEFLERLGRIVEARLAFTEALMLTENAVERAFLEERLAALPD
ncbi:MAG: sigma-70 family RNA polymerase sigma factor [Hamadaea sp.]|nr:sigma-70 family RNA polymerase sigma factor [Hamadaea sp.]